MIKEYFIKKIKIFIQFNKSFCKNLEKFFPNFFGTNEDWNKDLKKIIETYIDSKKPKKILEVGSSNRPIIKKSRDYSYFGLDIEKISDHNIYDKFLVQSIENKLDQKFDMIISKTLLEHVQDNTKSFTTIYEALNVDGVTMHYIPSKFHFYSVILRIVGHKCQKFLINYTRPETKSLTGYPAFFHKCSPKQLKELCKNVGFKKIETIYFYRATDYFSFFIPAFIIVAIFENLFKYFNLNFFVSGMILIAKKNDYPKIL